jgi:myosin heavy subunit
MRFFALVAGASKDSAPGLSNLQQIETKILDSNPILEGKIDILSN